MPIQIMGLRDYVQKKTGRVKKRTVFFEKMWRLDKIEDIFKDTHKYIDLIPEEDRVNLYFTMADCFETDKPRILKESWVIGFDIDSLGLDSPVDQNEIKAHCQKILTVCCDELHIDVSKVAAIFSGNGLQFFVRLTSPIMSADFYDTMREQFNIVCEKLQARLQLEHIAGKVDTSVFDAARLMRLPETWNEKPKKGKKRAFIVQDNLEPIEFRLEDITGDAQIQKADTLNKEAWKKYPTPDKKGVLAGCSYLKWAKDKPNDLSEEQWYAMLGIVSFLPDGENLAHEYSSGYKNYDPQETEEKYNQAVRASGPRLCKDISKRWSGCKACPYYNAVSTPIQIKSEDYIATKDTGFRTPSFDKDGRPKSGKVEFEDLVKQFLYEHEYAKVDKNGMYVYKAEAKKWLEYSSNLMQGWMRDKVMPRPSSNDMREFVSRMAAVNIKPKNWLDGSDNRHTNFNNGVLDRDTMELKPHSPDYGFKYVLPFDFNPHARAPIFENYLDSVTQGNKSEQQTLLEFGGYCLSGDDYWEHKALILVGVGNNGKSVFIETLAALAGPDNVSAVTMGSLGDPVNRHALVNKLFNYSEENSQSALLNSEVFKQLSSGGVVRVKHLYEQPFDYKNKAKILMACNEMPINRDFTNGMIRRMLPIGFRQNYTLETRNVHLKKDVLKEASGIYNLFLNAYSEMKKRKHIHIPNESVDLLDKYNVEQDPIYAFIKEKVKDSVEKFIAANELYSTFQSYYEINGYRRGDCPSQHAFTRRLGALDRKFVSVVRKINNKSLRVFEGVSLQEDSGI